MGTRSRVMFSILKHASARLRLEVLASSYKLRFCILGPEELCLCPTRCSIVQDTSSVSVPHGGAAETQFAPGSVPQLNSRFVSLSSAIACQHSEACVFTVNSLL